MLHFFVAAMFILIGELIAGVYLLFNADRSFGKTMLCIILIAVTSVVIHWVWQEIKFYWNQEEE